MHVVVIALPCWYVDCIDPAFPPFSVIYYYLLFVWFQLLHESIITLINCAEKLFCEPKAVFCFVDQYCSMLTVKIVKSTNLSCC